jgi:hypothetical protein
MLHIALRNACKDPKFALSSSISIPNLLNVGLLELYFENIFLSFTISLLAIASKYSFCAFNFSKSGKKSR